MTSPGFERQGRTRQYLATLALAGLALGFHAGARADASSDFAARCAGSGVLRCVSFDSNTDIAGQWGANTGITAGDVAPKIDTTIHASGAGSLQFIVPSNSGSGASGSYWANFSTDLSQQFGQNSDFFIQWRQRFSPEFLSTYYTGGGGWKQAIIGTGDQPGGKIYSSCSALETVVQNTDQRGFAQMYNSCTGSNSHGPYDPFVQAIAGADFKLQNGRPSPYCLYSQGNTNPKTYFPPAGNCFGYFPNEWMTFQVEIKTGPLVSGEFTNSYVNLWIGRDGKPSELVMQWGPYNLTAGDASENQKYGKIWLLPYHTNKDPTQTHPVGYVWYDELIISKNKIPDPGVGSGPKPNPPTNVTVH